ncbi:MAG: type II toxin-antitoxin system VapC family toxin [Planctomycetota bacterium]
MTLVYLLDTSIISIPISSSPNSKAVGRISKHSHECAVAAPVWHELIFGCERLPVGKRRSAIEIYLKEVVLKSFPILAYESAAAEWHGLERARLEKIGKPAPYVDGQLASIAHVNRLILVTANMKDFSRFGELTVENWAN